MTVSCDMNNPVCRVRVAIGDAETPYLLDDAVIQYLIDNNTTENEAILKAVQAAMTATLKHIDEKTDEAEAKWSQLYDHYRQLFTDLTTNPSFMPTVALPIFGGTSKAEMKRVHQHRDSNLPPVQAGSWDSSTRVSTNDLDHYSFLEDNF